MGPGCLAWPLNPDPFWGGLGQWSDQLRRETSWAPGICRPALRAALIAPLSGALVVVMRSHLGASSSSALISTASLRRLVSAWWGKEKRVGTAFRILCQFDIPPGSGLLPPGGAFGGAGPTSTDEITAWSVAADQKNLGYDIQADNNPGLGSFNLDQLPLDGGAVKVMALDQPVQLTVLRP